MDTSDLTTSNARSAAPLALSPVDPTKLSPPRGGSRLVPRERLHAQLLDARRQRCVVLTGPAGFGKTTALVAWRQKLLPLGFDVAWLTLSSDDNQLARFFDCLLASVAQVAPAIARDAQLLEGYGSDSETIERIIIMLVRGIAAHPRELVLMLDDLHALTDIATHQALQWLLDYAPHNLHLVLASRSAIPLSLARLRSNHQILELDLRDLRFTQAEAEQFLKAQLGDIGPDNVRLVYEMTNGWIAGMQLVAASRKKHRRRRAGAFQDLARVHLQDNQAFADFFAAEVLAQLAADDLQTLLHMAVCEHFCASLCGALVGRPAAVDEAKTLLKRLERDNLFLIPIAGADGEAWYRLHPLLRETLLKLLASQGEAAHDAIHARAWVWFRDHGYLREAVWHAVRGGEAQAATRFVEQQVEPLYAQGNLRMLVDLVRQLPVAELHASVPLRMLLVRAQIYSRDFAACDDELQRLDQAIPKSDAETRFRLAMLRAILAVQRDDSDSAMALVPELLHPPKHADAIMLGGSLNVLSWLYMHRGEFELARRVQLERPLLLVDGVPLLGTTGGSLQGRCLIGLSLAMEGQMIQAERIYREVLFDAERGGRTCFYARCLATSLLGEVLYENNEVEAAFQLLVDWVDVAERVSIPDSFLRLLEVLGKCQWQRGHHAEAFAYMERLASYASKLGLARLLARSLARRSYWHLQLGNLASAEPLLAQLDALDARHPNAEGSSLRDIHILAEYIQVRWQAASGDLPGAAQRLEQVIVLSEASGRQLSVTRLKMLGAVYDAQLGRLDLAREKVLATLRAGHRYGQMRSLLDADPSALQLITQITQSEDLDPVLAFYCERLQATSRQLPATPADVEASQQTRLRGELGSLSERELEVLRLLAQTLPNKKIALALGVTPETVKWYLRQIFSKLEVNSRDAAVARLHDLDAGTR